MRLPMSLLILVTLIALPCGLLGEPPNLALKDDFKALVGGEWHPPADKSEGGVRLRFTRADDGDLLFSVWVYPDAEAKKRGLRVRASGGGAELQEEKGTRFIYYGDRENKITYRLQEGKLVLQGKYTKGVDLEQVLDLSGEWVKVPSGELTPRPVITANTLGMKFALVQAGEFLMGSPDTDPDAAPSEMPQHKVRISRHYFLGVHPVTVGQFKAFVAATGYQTEAETSGQGGYRFDAGSRAIEQGPAAIWKNPGFEQTDQHPVVNVSWHDAVTFCNWLSKHEKQRYRLPTEAEWEYACRAGTTTRFHTGDAADSLKGRANIADRAFKERFAPDSRWPSEDWDDGFAFTSPVGKFKPNAWGLCDMPGNVWNWCADWYDANYYANSPTEDPKGPAPGEQRVIRGGCWGRDAKYARSACRLTCVPVPRSCKVGFRVVLETAE